MLEEVDVLITIGLLDHEQVVVQAHFHRHAVGRADPVNHAFHLAAFRVFTQGVEIDGAVQLNNLTYIVFNHVITANYVAVAQAHFFARC